MTSLIWLVAIALPVWARPLPSTLINYRYRGVLIHVFLLRPGAGRPRGLWRESLGRVAAEALINGNPVLASRRGSLPETLEEAGFVFDVPQRYTPESRDVPTAEEVRPWVETIIRLWDDAAFYKKERQRCLAAAEAWRPERLAPRFEEFFTQVVHWSGRRQSSLACG